MTCDGLRILLVEDDEGSRRMVARFLEDSGFAVTAVPDAEEAERVLARETPAVVLADYKLPGKDGIELIRGIRSHPGAPPCILITAHGDVQSAVAAMRAGAFHFLEKPVSPERLEEVVRQACERERMAIEIERLRRQLDEKYGFENLLGISKPMREVFEKVKLVALTNSTVLIVGESGTGKELVARAIHQSSGRRDAPFVPVNCAALPESLVESELFGHERGAFTG
ncbi:MAG: sigma-54-dependent Fis family transcriptional regulator, partial [Planctomycetes bacterium]|nr:sigma-54-dependent Fis family transcriptional regulator [Planctomycetota bacterium]